MKARAANRFSRHGVWIKRARFWQYFGGIPRDIEDMILKAKDCIQEESAYCTGACPMGLDVRAFLTKAAAGNFNGAYKQYRQRTLFPNIVSHICDGRCASACVRKDVDEAVDVRGVEKAVCAYKGQQDQSLFFYLDKKERVAVVGGGLAGLTSAVIMAEKGYHVDLFERSGRLGGKLLGLDPAVLPPKAVGEDLDPLLHKENLRIFFNTEICSLEHLEADVILIATGDGGAHFGLMEGSPPFYDEISLQSGQEHVFLAGELISGPTEDALRSMMSARRASLSMERFLKQSSLILERTADDFVPTRLYVNIKAIPIAHRAKDYRAEGLLTQNAAKAEAARCIKCECKECVKSCVFLKHYRSFPKHYILQNYQTLKTGEKHAVNISARQINSCNLCGLCGDLCPNALDMSEIYQSSREIMWQKEKMPWAFHEFWLEDMRFSQGPEAEVLFCPPGRGQCGYMFFPGCQIGAAVPQVLKKTYGYLCDTFNNDVALKLSCCGAPGWWSGKNELTGGIAAAIRRDWEQLGKPIVILACPTCYKIFNMFAKDIQCVMIWDIIGSNPLTGAKPENFNTAFAVFDPCSVRGSLDTMGQVREALRAHGFRTEDLPYGKEFARCCGFGGLIEYANPALAAEIAQDRVSQSLLPYVTYCVNCRDTFRKFGKESYHVLELLLGEADPLENALELLTWSEKRENRRILKKDICKPLPGTLLETDGEARLLLDISPELRKKIDKEWILTEHVEAVVRFCEKNGEKVRIGSGDVFAGHLQQGKTTYWVIYRRKDAAFEVLNAYAHRMEISGI
jgi:Fe-S oxidoreductase